MPAIDPRALNESWARRWPGHPPIGHQLRGGDRWVRFHSLPDSKRYAESDHERIEVLRRYNTVLDALVTSPASASDMVVVITASWSDGSVPCARDDVVAAAAPGATYWRSSPHDDDEWWIHLYAEPMGWQSGVLDRLLALVAEEGTQDVVIGGPDFEWLFHPYDGGADVLARSPAERDQLRERHGAWLSSHPSGM